ncbi:hypothetical protein H7X46_08010 [Pseudonocardia sp. C8]|uniref:hypothetical protein n=1 Tax=Pseudonocardia sp. C8 TaxID=2762759 RepID=UPI001642B82D|nr:hypothetical protein [Pseudonocardia sp. C8]MBC3191004.1 hypothetical protein [Pseudonocardia sp. C8]
MDKLREIFNRPSRAPETAGPRVVDEPDAKSTPSRAATTDERTVGTDTRVRRDEAR